MDRGAGEEGVHGVAQVTDFGAWEERCPSSSRRQRILGTRREGGSQQTLLEGRGSAYPNLGPCCGHGGSEEPIILLPDQK